MKRSLVVLVVLSLLGVLGCAQPNSVPGPSATSGGAKAASPSAPNVETSSSPSPRPQADPKALAAALKRINELDGKVTYNARKEVVGVDLFERATTNADLALLKALPALAELEVWARD